MKSMFSLKNIGKVLPILIFVLIGVFAFYAFNTKADMVYKLLKDSNGITWQYGYNPSTKELEVSFFQSDNSNITSIVIPESNFFTSKDSSIGTFNSYIFTNYEDHNLGIPTSFTSKITKIDLSNVSIVNGIKPLQNTNSVMEITLNSNATEIGKDTFRALKLDVKNLNKVTDIGPGAFYNVTFSTTDIKLPNLKTLGDGSFENSNITFVELNPEIIGVSAFKNCKSLTSVKLLDNVLEIGASAFEGDENLIDFTFNNVKIVGNLAFKNCTNWNIDLKDTKIEELGSEVFSGDTKYTKTTIPSKVKQLKYQAFYNSGMSDIDINSVYDIGPQAFENCNLSNVDFKSVEKIQWRAFANNHLTEIYLPKSIVYLRDEKVFYNNQIKKVTIAYDTLSTGVITPLYIVLGHEMSYPDSSVSVWNDKRYNTDKYVEEVVLIAPYKENENAEIKNSLGENFGREYIIMSTDYSKHDRDENYGNVMQYKNVLQSHYLSELKNLKKLEIGEGYEFIGENSICTTDNDTRTSTIYPGWVFNKNFTFDASKYKLSDVVLPSTLKGIGSQAFEGVLNGNNVNINLPEGLEYIGRRAFGCNYGFSNEIDLPNLKYLGDYVFEGTMITGITYHDKLIFIGQNTGNLCLNIKKIILDCDYFGIVQGYSRTSSFTNSFLIWTYYDWNTKVNFDLIRFTEKVKNPPIAQYSYVSLFYRIKAKELDLEKVPWIEMPGNDFQETEIGNLRLPKNLTKINYSMFYKTKLENILELPKSITEIGNNAFMGSNIIVPGNIPPKVTRIGQAAFADTLFNENIVIPSTVTSIGTGAFQNAKNYFSGHVANFPNLHRKSITFNCPLLPDNTSGSTISQLLWDSTVDEIIFGDNVTELPSKRMGSNEFWNTNVKKVTFKNLVELPDKAFFENSNIEEVDFSEDPNLQRIGSYAFYKTSSLEKVKLYRGLNINLGEFAFHSSGLSSLGDEHSSLDIQNNNITLEGESTFAYMPKLSSVNLTNSLNDGVIPRATFYKDLLLESVILNDDIKELKTQAFGGDENISIFVMYGDTKIENEDGNQMVTLKNINKINFYLDTSNNDFTIKVKDSKNGNSTISYSNFSYNSNQKLYTYIYTKNNDISSLTLETSDKVFIDKVNDNTIYIRDIINPYVTIPGGANLYCYSKNEDCNTYNETYKDLRDMYDSDLYYLDEVIYLDSNNNTVKLTDDKKLETDDITVYALRRDGIILISEKWGEMTDAKKYVDSGITIRDYDASTTDPRLMVFNTSRELSKIDLETNDNFENLDYEVGDTDPTTGRAFINLLYTNKVVNTQPTTVLKTKGNYVDVVYSDGCGGESFANVIFEDVLIGTTTPAFTGETPTREGYKFVGWDKEVSDIALEDVTYTAIWEKIEIEYPEIIKDIPTPQEEVITNPYTKNSILIILFVIITVGLGLGYQKFKKSH